MRLQWAFYLVLNFFDFRSQIFEIETQNQRKSKFENRNSKFQYTPGWNILIRRVSVHMLEQIRKLSKCAAAYVTLVLFLSLVDAHVYDKRILPDERFAELLVSVWPTPCMLELVPPETFVLLKPRAARVTPVWLHARMNHHVFLLVV